MNKNEIREIIDTRIMRLIDKYYFDLAHGFPEFCDMYESAIIENILIAFRLGVIGVAEYLRLVDICVMIGSGRTMEERLRHEH